MKKLIVISLVSLSISVLQSLDIPSKEDFRDKDIPWTPVDTDEIIQQIER